MSRSILGAEFSSWINQHLGNTCPLCGGEISYTPVGMAEGQSQHRVECDCTVIESGPVGNSEESDNERRT